MRIRTVTFSAITAPYTSASTVRSPWPKGPRSPSRAKTVRPSRETSTLISTIGMPRSPRCVARGATHGPPPPPILRRAPPARTPPAPRGGRAQRGGDQRQPPQRGDPRAGGVQRTGLRAVEEQADAVHGSAWRGIYCAQTVHFVSPPRAFSCNSHPPFWSSYPFFCVPPGVLGDAISTTWIRAGARPASAVMATAKRLCSAASSRWLAASCTPATLCR